MNDFILYLGPGLFLAMGAGLIIDTTIRVARRALRKGNR